MVKVKSMPHSVARRIMERCATNEPFVVVPREGKPSRFFGVGKYNKMRELPNLVKPWEHRKKAKETPDPLGAVDADPPLGLSRKNLYEED